MSNPHQTDPRSWRTKPTDRFVLRWIKVRLSARLTPLLARWPGLRPGHVTLVGAGFGVAAGVVFATGHGWPAGCLAAIGQVLDGADGQLARLTGRTSRGGAFWDSVLDRYSDGAFTLGLVVYLLRRPLGVPAWGVLALAALAILGAGQVSYTSARAASLGIDLGRPTLASKGTRTSVMILGAWASALWRPAPLLALGYLAIHANTVVVARLIRAARSAD
jgi:phosphatidylglycerophosphate synthase